MSAIETAVEEYFDRVAPDGIKKDASHCRWDLYHGPLYFSPDGEACSWADVGAEQFDFCGAVDRLEEWFGEFSAVYYVEWVPEVTALPNPGDEASEIESRYLRDMMFGRELSALM